jgi:hypothetical protein
MKFRNLARGLFCSVADIHGILGEKRRRKNELGINQMVQGNDSASGFGLNPL